MIRFINNPALEHLQLQAPHNLEIEAGHLTLLPALIDPHVHFRTPGHTHKEDWKSAAQAAIAGGVTQVFDMPNNRPSCNTSAHFQQKVQLIEEQLLEARIPLRYQLYMGADQNHLEELEKLPSKCVGVKVYLGSTTGDLLLEDLPMLKRVFDIANQHQLILSFHSESERILSLAKKQIPHPKVLDHPLVRPRKAAIASTEQIIELANDYPMAKICILHISTLEEVELIRQAKKKGLKIFGETTPNHLFLDASKYLEYGSLMQMNPPVRESKDQQALWQGIDDQIIDWIGTDHAPHTLEEKSKPYPDSPSGIPGIETLLPLLLNAVNEQRLSIEKLIQLTRTNIERIFAVPTNDDFVLVDLSEKKKVDNQHLFTKCGWSPYHGWTLIGWPQYTCLKNHLYRCHDLVELTS